MDFSIPKAAQGMALGNLQQDYGDYGNINKSATQGFGQYSGVGNGVYGAATALGSIPGDQLDPSAPHSSYFSKLQNEQKAENQGLDTFSKAASAVPVYGWVAAAGAQGVKASNTLSKNKYGIYKSRAAGAIDNNFNFVTGVKNAEALINKPTLSGVINESTLGIFGKNAAQEEAKRQKTIMQNQSITDNVASNEMQGNLAGAMIDRYQSPAYGKKGMRLSKFSRNVC